MSVSAGTSANGSGASGVPGHRAARWGRLGMCVAAVAAFWLIALPWLASRPTMSRRLEWLEEQKVDPSAMYYTELEVLKPVLARLNAGQRLPPGEPTASRASE